jgi:hypothetical protein
MAKILAMMFSIALIISCSQQIEQQSVGGLKKISYSSEEQLQALKDSGAEIIVQEPKYVVVRTDEMLQALDVQSTNIKEIDLVQRLVFVHLKDSTSLQTVVNTGVDLWQVVEDTAIVRAFDLYINEMRDAGLDLRIIAQDASKWEGEK